MRTSIVALPVNISPKDLAQQIHSDHGRRGQRLYPVVDNTGHLTGVVTSTNLQELLQEQRADGSSHQLTELVEANPVVAYPDEPLRAVVYRMAETGLTRFPVVERNDPRKLLGMISLNDLLKARVRNLEAEQRRERLLPIRLVFPLRSRRLKTSPR